MLEVQQVLLEMAEPLPTSGGARMSGASHQVENSRHPDRRHRSGSRNARHRTGHLTSSAEDARFDGVSTLLVPCGGLPAAGEGFLIGGATARRSRPPWRADRVVAL
jgi:hypothetical protein